MKKIKIKRKDKLRARKDGFNDAVFYREFSKDQMDWKLCVHYLRGYNEGIFFRNKIEFPDPNSESVEDKPLIDKLRDAYINKPLDSSPSGYEYVGVLK